MSLLHRYESFIISMNSYLVNRDGRLCIMATHIPLAHIAKLKALGYTTDDLQVGIRGDGYIISNELIENALAEYEEHRQNVA